MIECANSESTGEMRQFSVRRHLSSASGKGGQWVVHPVDSNAFLYRVQATIKYNVLLSCLRLLFIMGRKGGFSCPGGEQKLLMELFRENACALSSHFHAGWRAKRAAHGSFLRKCAALISDFHARVGSNACLGMFFIIVLTKIFNINYHLN
jgi:hypothetical protein